MTRALVLGLTAVAGLLAGFGCDTNCMGPTVIEGAVTSADRAALIGATVSLDASSVAVEYTNEAGISWVVSYNVP